MKDPLHNEKTPYEILDIAQNATPKEIQEGFGKFLKTAQKDGKNIQEGMTARKKLTSIKDRIDVDIFYYCLGDMEISEEPADLNIDVHDFLEVPIWDSAEAFTDLDREDFSKDFEEITFKPLKIGDLEQYNELRECKMEVVFDK